MTIYNDTLTKTSVSIQSDEYGMRAYVNSIHGREKLEKEVSIDIITEIYKIWGNTATVIEDIFEDTSKIVTPSDQDKINASIMLEIAKLKAGV